MTAITAIPAYQDNYIWLIQHQHTAIVIDPGEAVSIQRYLAQHSLHLAAILVTHHHNDHQGGINDLLTHTNGSLPRIFGPAAESITGLTDPLQGGETLINLGIDKPITVLATPGHTLGHLSYCYGDALFCGDTLFGAGCGRLFEGTAEQMKASLDRLAALPDTTRIFCAHEYTLANLRFAVAVEPDNPAIQARIAQVTQCSAMKRPSLPTAISTEKNTNPFLRCNQPAVIQSAQRFLDTSRPLTELEVFTALRRWKDQF